MVTVGVLSPRRKPSDSFITNDLFPLAGILGTGIGASAAMLMVISSGYTRSWGGSAKQVKLRKVWRGTNLECALLRVLAPTTEQARGFNPEIANLLSTAVKRARHIFRSRSFFYSFSCFFSAEGGAFFFGFVFLEVLRHGTNITAFELLTVSRNCRVQHDNSLIWFKRWCYFCL